MNLNADTDAGTKRPSVPAPAGTHAGRIYFVIDLGTQDDTYNNVTTKKRKVQVGVELSNTLMPIMNPGETPKPFVVSKDYTATLSGDNSRMKKIYNAVMGVTLTSEEAKAGVNTSLLIGRECLVVVAHYTGRDGTIKAKIQDILSPMAGVPVPPLRNETIDFEIGAPNQFQVFPKMYSWIRQIICKSPEFMAECMKIGTTPAALHQQATDAWKAANPLPPQGQQQQQSAMQPNQQWMQQGQQQYQQPPQNWGQQQYQQPMQQPVQQPYQQPQPQYQQPNPYQQPAQYPPQQPPAQPVQQPQRTMTQQPQPGFGQQQQPGFGQQQPPMQNQQPGFGTIVTDGQSPTW